MTVHVDQRDGTAVLRMDAGKVNAMDLALLEDLTGALTAVARDPGVRAVVLTGNDRVFCAGVDLPAIVQGGPAHARAFITALGACFEAVLRCPLPVVAAVEGHAIAGGCVLFSAADHRVVVDDPRARLGLTELAVGVPFPTSAVEVMRWRLGDAALARRVLLADTVPAADALAHGLADQVVPAEQLLDRALEVAQQLAAVPADAFALTKAQLQAGVRERIDARRGAWEERVSTAWGSEQTLTAIGAFVERTLRR